MSKNVICMIFIEMTTKNLVIFINHYLDIIKLKGTQLL